MKFDDVQPQERVPPVGDQLAFAHEEQGSEGHRPERLPSLRGYFPLVRRIAKGADGQADRVWLVVVHQAPAGYFGDRALAANTDIFIIQCADVHAG